MLSLGFTKLSHYKIISFLVLLIFVPFTIIKVLLVPLRKFASLLYFSVLCNNLNKVGVNCLS